MTIVKVTVRTMSYVLCGFEGFLLLPFLPGEKRSEGWREDGDLVPSVVGEGGEERASCFLLCCTVPYCTGTMLVP